MAHCKANQLDTHGFCNRFDAPCIKKNCRFFGVKTNADRIRAMSDEKIAAFFNKVVVCEHLRVIDDGYCKKCPLKGAKPCDTEGIQDWLKQPAEE